ncbi:MAG: urease accessory protein UreD [Hyphomicrobiales bacterium]|nr:urease accessory protein UreD [Hyphomicrobiales bacterium]
MLDVHTSAPPRARGEIDAAFAATAGRTRIARLYETGGLRLRFPRAGSLCEAVIVNTAGGIVGGDAARLRFTAQAHSAVEITSQSAEKIYRSDGALATLETRLTVEPGAHTLYFPQEAILFDGARLARRLEADMAEGATLVLCESVVFGRIASGEQCRAAAFSDRWRVRRAGKLVFAEDMRIEGDIAAALDRPAVGAGARAFGLLAYLGADAENLCNRLRERLDGAQENIAVGVSAFEGQCIMRCAARAPDALRTAMVDALATLRGRDAPRVWQ